MSINFTHISEITVIISHSTDTLLFKFNDIKDGCWPFKGLQLFKVEVAKGSYKKWLTDNFGEEILKMIKVVDV